MPTNHSLQHLLFEFRLFFIPASGRSVDFVIGFLKALECKEEMPLSFFVKKRKGEKENDAEKAKLFQGEKGMHFAH